jgi:hypothetical protein
MRRLFLLHTAWGGARRRNSKIGIVRFCPFGSCSAREVTRYWEADQASTPPPPAGP